LTFEPLEDRCVPALTLVSILPNTGGDLQDGDNLTEAPRELTLRFNVGASVDPTTLSTGIQILRSGFDDVFANGNDIVVSLGFLDIGDQPNDVVVRFAESLPDERYQIQLIGSGMTPLRDSGGSPFNNGVDQFVTFDLDLGPRLLSVVPQPVSRDLAGDLQQADSQIIVFFNNDPLLDGNVVGGAENPAYYQLIDAFGSVTNPASINYDPATNTAVLDFGAPLAEGTYRLRIGNNDPLPVGPLAIGHAPDGGANSNSSFADAFDLGQIGALVNPGGLVVTSSIDALPFNLDLPGALNEPGHRDIPYNGQDHLGGADSTTGISVWTYTLNTTVSYGNDPISGAPLFSQITETQKQRARELVSLWSSVSGLQFVEVDAPPADLWILTGDPRVLLPQVPPTAVGGVGGGGLAIQNAFLNWGTSEFDSSWAIVAWQEIGHNFGLGHTDDLPLSVMRGGAASGPGTLFPEFAGELVRPHQDDIVHIQHLFRPESRDIDLFRIEVVDPGSFRAEVVAERLSDSSLLDSVLSLYQHTFTLLRAPTAGIADGQSFDITVGATTLTFEFEDTTIGDGISGDVAINFAPSDSPAQIAQATAAAINGAGLGIVATTDGDSVRVEGRAIVANASALLVLPLGELIARNDDFFSSDSFIEIESVAPGFYYLAVTSIGNTSFDPSIPDSGFGGITQGPYELRISLSPTPAESIVDVDGSGPGTVFDGDADGQPGGEFNFWFEVGTTIFVDKANDTVPGTVEGDGSLGDPFDTLSAALSRAAHRIIAPLNGGADLTDGQTFVLNDGLNAPVVFEFEDTTIGDGVAAGNVAVNFTPSDSRSDVASSIFNAIDSAVGSGLLFAAPIDPAGGFVVDVNGPILDLSGTPALLQAVNLVRIVGNGGADNNQNTLRDNVAYQIGFDNSGNPLADGSEFRVPQGATVMIDAGAVFKSQSAIIEVGSAGLGDDRQTGALQVLGMFDPDAPFPTMIASAGASLVDGQTFTINGRVFELDSNGVFDVANVRVPFTTANSASVVATNIAGAINGAGLPAVTATATGASVSLVGVYDFDVSTATGLTATGGQGQRVWFTSFRDDTIGGDDDGPSVGARSGDWGGIVFRNNSDMEDSAVFLSAIFGADLQHGGGQVLVDSVLTVANSIDIQTARPLVAYNTIRNAADAALAATPDSFEETLVAQFTSLVDFDRIGHDLRGNRLVNNDINGLFVRIDTGFGSETQRLTVNGRFDDSDIVHVVAENLFIQGTPGGPTESFGVRTARLDARLGIDPGIVVKLNGARIEVEMGAQLLAEATEGNEIIFTSVFDDTHGRGGTFDTTNDGSGSTAAPGDWGGVYFHPLSSGSIDRSVLSYGGGDTPIEGGFENFNVLEIRQAAVRVTNSVLENNAAGTASSTRNGRGFNAATAIFVRGAQPVIVDNVFQNNAGSAISIDPNAMLNRLVVDWGRSTGLLDDFEEFDQNRGPLVRDNRLDGNSINAMIVRGGAVSTETVWDDTDIVHVLFDEIRVTNFHVFGGLRLESSPTASLVVKLAGANAGFTSIGTPLDIDDRIGGILQIVGSPNFPVILTSLADDTAGAGLTPAGTPQVDTNNDGNASTPNPGDWRSVRFENDTNDRNVAVMIESERGVVALDGSGQPIDFNGTTSSAENLGDLAPSETAADDNRRAGFVAYGYIALNNPGDVDVYTFTANAGTEVWLDIDRTTQSLDTIVELVDATGAVLARSVNSYEEFLDPTKVEHVPTVNANPLQKDPFIHQLFGGSDPVGDLYSVNPRDAGFRVVLPGTTGVLTRYYVRVRSNPLVDPDPLPRSDLNLQPLDGGLTTGEYQLQVRLRQVDETTGSTARFADIRFATNGIEVFGMPQHSPITGEATEQSGDTSDEGFGAAQALGNLLTMDRNTISVAGTMQNADDVDWYSFTVDYELVQAVGGLNGGAKTWAAVFDIDYADGLTRADTVVSVFDSNGNLVLVSRDSDIEDDQPRPGFGQDAADLTRGSFGDLDPYIGSVQLPEGNNQRYFVAISSNRRLPTALNMTFQAGAANETIKLEPVISVERLREDHIGFTGYTSGDPIIGSVPVAPADPDPLIDISSSISLQTHVRPFRLSDVVLFVSQGFRLTTVDPSTGLFETDIGQLGGGLDSFRDIVIRSDGLLFGYQRVNATANTAGRLVRIDPANAAQTAIGNDAIPDTVLNTNDMDALAWRRTDVGQYDLFYSVRDSVNGQSVLFRADPSNGSAAVQTGQPWGPIGPIFEAATGDVGITTGLAFIGNTLFGVSDAGFLYTVSTFSGAASVLAATGFSFAGLAIGPQNLDFDGDGTGGDLADTLFAITTGGTLVAFDTSGTQLAVFDSNTDGIADSTTASTGLGGVTGLAFSPLDVNLWHPTMRRRSNEGHGINSTFDNSRPNPGGFNVSINGRSSNEGEGGASLYFGLEDWVTNPVASNAYFTYGPNAQFGFTLQRHHEDLTSATTGPGGATIGNNYNLPGGAHGSLITDSFSLQGYTESDKPTVYFNYYLVTQNANSSSNGMRDAARVHISSDGGLTWSPLATNNSVLSTVTTPAELPRYLTASAQVGSGDPQQRVQEVFDTTDGSNEWRQARIDLADFAGLPNLILRFDFSTAGDITDPSLAGLPEQDSLPGDAFGNFTSPERGQNNDFEGFFIDDIIIGFAERGEMVTGANANTSFFVVPQNPVFGAPQESLVGPYQLEVRRATESAVPANESVSPIVVVQQFDTNDRLAPGISLVVPSGAGVADGEEFTINNGLRTVTFEFNDSGGVNAANVAVNFNGGMTPGQLAAAIAAAINGVANFNVTAITKPTSVNHNLVDLVGAVGVNTVGSGLGDFSYNRLGDQNLPRDQGMILIQSNQISDAAQFGIVVDAGARDANAHPGGARNLLTLNNQRLTYSVLVENNLIVEGGQGGILFSGDPNTVATDGIAPVPFGRIVNNTIFGGETANGFGIRVTENASPTILNNIIANTTTAISVDGTSGSTVVGTTLFQGNTTIGRTGNFAILLSPTDPLFVDVANRNFYLLAGSRAIDSSLTTLVDRPAITSVTSDVGIAPSPIMAPTTDLFGQLRVDDPNSQPPPGLGRNVFIDRGALERTDFTGPTVAIVTPQDNAAGDVDPTLTNVVVFGQFTDFVFQFSDVGLGIDDVTVTSAAFTVTLDGTPLAAGADFLFSYDPVNNVVRLTSAAGFYAVGVYDVVIDNVTVRDRAGNRLLANRLTGETAFTITIGVDTLIVNIASAAINEDSGLGATSATITRLVGDNSTPLTVNLSSSDTTEATIVASVIIPSNQNSVIVPIDAAGDDGIVDGTQTVTITATASGFVTGSDTLDVLDTTDFLTVVIAANSIDEDDGPMATTATITRNQSDNSSPLTVTLTSSDTTEAVLAASTIIPANQASVTVDIGAAGDDGIRDGTQTVTITASALGFIDGSDTVDVIDITNLPDLTISLSVSSIAENAGASAATATVTRPGSTAAALTVNLVSSDTTEATVPASVIIPISQSFVVVPINAVDDNLLDGTQSVTITASDPAGGFDDATAVLQVTDHETLTLTIAVNSVFENAGAGATTASVTRSNTGNLGSPLVVTLSSSDTSEITVPPSVTIPAGQASVTFALDAVDDSIIDDTQTVTITATAAGYVTGTDTIDVRDNDRPPFAVGVAENFLQNRRFFLDANNSRTLNSGDAIFVYGLANDRVITGDWDGNFFFEVGVARPNGSGGLVFTLDANSNRIFDGGDAAFNFGLENDIIVVGDWNGNQITDLGVARPNGTGGLVFSLDVNGNRVFDGGDAVFNFGLQGDIVVVGDWNGNGVFDLGVARPNGTGGLVFSLDSNGNRMFDGGDAVFNFGLVGDQIVVGDWNADRTSELGVARPSSTSGLLRFSLDLNGNRTFDVGDVSFDYGPSAGIAIAGAWAPALFAAGSPIAGGLVPRLTNEQLSAVLREAVDLWAAAGISDAELADLRQVDVRITDLASDHLGLATATQILIDQDAAGFGWFVDSTPESSEEYTYNEDGELLALAGSAAAGRMDLLTVLAHELGHVIGRHDLPHEDHPQDVMTERLEAGIRRLPPREAAVDAVFESGLLDDLLSLNE
jgi:hypothetical protein